MHAMPTIAELQAELREQIPIAAAMGLSLEHLDARALRFTAPLAANINDKGTAFGGSVASLLLLAGWTLVQQRLRREEVNAQVVIRDFKMQFLAPIHSDFTASAALPAEDQWDHLRKSLDTRGRGGISLVCEARADRRVAARLEGIYVALRGDGS